MGIRSFAAPLALAISFVMFGAAKAQEYPTRTVRLIVPFTAGGATDTAARLVARHLEGQWKQPVVVENRPGGAQMVGGEAAKNSPADGYTILCYISDLAHEDLLTDTTFNLLRDFQQVAMIAGSGVVLTVPSSHPASTLREFINYAKANPGKVNEATIGPTGVPQITRMWQANQANVTKVSFNGGSVAIVAVLGGQVDIVGASPLDVIAHQKAGKVKLLAYSDADRHPLFPSTPTFAEALGTQDFTWRYYIALAVPRGTPANVVGRLNQSTIAAVEDPEVKGRFDTLGMRTFRETPAGARAADEAVRRTAEQLIAAGILKKR